MKRQRGRNRGGGGQGGKTSHNVNRAFDSNGPDGVKIRGAAQHVFEKYQQLARDSFSSGDRVLAENYLQHAEHYFRLLRAFQPQKPASEIIGRDAFSSGLDIDFEDESLNEPPPAEASAEGQPAAPAGEGEAGEGGEARPEARGEARGEWRDRNGRRDRDRDRDFRRDRDRDRFEGREERRERFEARDRDRGDPLAVVEPEAAPLPRSEDREERGPTLRAQDGALSPAPAFLQPRAEAPRPDEGEEGAAKRPRRRRAPRSFEGAAEEAPAEAGEG